MAKTSASTSASLRARFRACLSSSLLSSVTLTLDLSPPRRAGPSNSPQRRSALSFTLRRIGAFGADLWSTRADFRAKFSSRLLIPLCPPRRTGVPPHASSARNPAHCNVRSIRARRRDDERRSSFEHAVGKLGRVVEHEPRLFDRAFPSRSTGASGYGRLAPALELAITALARLDEPDCDSPPADTPPRCPPAETPPTQPRACRALRTPTRQPVQARRDSGN